MAFTAADVIDAARDRHPSFDPKAQPESVLLRGLQQYARSLASLVMRWRPSAMVATELVTALPLASFSAGITLPAHLFIQSIMTVRLGYSSPQEEQPVRLLPLAQRTRFGAPFPAAFVQSGTLFLTGRPTDWANYTSVTVRYVPVPTVSTAATQLPFTDDAMTPMVAWLAAFMGARRQGMDDAPPRGFGKGEAIDAEELFLQHLQRQSAGEDTVIQDVYGDNGGW